MTNTDTAKTVSASPDKEARRAQLREVAQRVAKMSEDERTALAARVSVTTIEGRGLSLHNQCLLALQIPAATKPQNKKRHSPIPWLALHIAIFNAKCDSKAALAEARARMADRIYSLSEPVRSAQ